MNTYETDFFCACPVNGARIQYGLAIATANRLMVEELLRAVEGLPPSLHEDLADAFSRQFGGKQRLRAFHHGVWITTERGRDAA